jgi:hypothetical protein
MFYACGVLRRNAAVVVTNDVIIVESFVACMGQMSADTMFSLFALYIGGPLAYRCVSVQLTAE